MDTERRRQLLFSGAAALGGSLLFAYAVRAVGLPIIADGIRRVGAGVFVILAIAGLRFCLRTQAWRLCMRPEVRLPFGRGAARVPGRRRDRQRDAARARGQRAHQDADCQHPAAGQRGGSVAGGGQPGLRLLGDRHGGGRRGRGAPHRAAEHFRPGDGAGGAGALRRRRASWRSGCCAAPGRPSADHGPRGAPGSRSCGRPRSGSPRAIRSGSGACSRSGSSFTRSRCWRSISSSAGCWATAGPPGRSRSCSRR